MQNLNFDGKACSHEVKFKSLYHDDESPVSNPINAGGFEDEDFNKNDGQIMRSLDCLACMNGANINYRKFS